jgi:hypothetical protein
VTARPMPAWCADCREIARLLSWLHNDDQHGPLDVADCICIVETPWRWDTEYQTLCAEQSAESVHEKRRGE